MANDIGIGEFPVVGMDEDDVELSLGLSIGGSFRKLEKLKPSKPKQSCSSGTDVTKSCEINIDKGENERGFCKSSSVSPIVNGDGIMDLQRKREIHALRRQEARRKREEKRQRNGICRRMNGGSNIPIRTCSIDDKIFLQAQMFQSRVRDREKAEGDGSSNEQYNTNLSLKNIQPLNQNPNSNSFGVSSSPQFPIVPHMQYVRFANGFGIPYVMPCLKISCATADDDKNVLQQFFQDQNPNRNHNLLARSVLEKKTSQSSIDSSGSSWWSSSSVSDYKSTSTQGGSSSESRSHSRNSPKEQLQLHGNTEEQSIHSNSSFPKGVEAINNEKDTLVSSKMSQTDPNKPEEPISINKLKEAKGEKTKPPRPKIPHSHSHSQTLFLPQIPCVSTTGNGPNGKTINGFLYRYTKKEVSIICVCHGSSFSPAEFVKHAGGEDISHPLRHIVVVPSTL